jgi:cytochrome c-type biogenesis protein
MDFLHSVLENNNSPIIIAFVLGLMTAISPCPMATNITAIAYTSKDIENRKQVFYNGLIYTFGRIIGYFSLAFIIYLGFSKYQVSKIFEQHGEKYLGFILLVFGIIMLDFISLRIPFISKLNQKLTSPRKAVSFWSVLIMGILFALAFCPYSGVIYFGMLIPLTTEQGLFLPVIFAITTALPVIIISYLIAFTVSGVGNFYNKIKVFEKWFRRIIAIVFIASGLYFIYIFYF